MPPTQLALVSQPQTNQTVYSEPIYYQSQPDNNVKKIEEHDDQQTITGENKPMCQTPDNCERALYDAKHKDQFMHNCRYGDACRMKNNPIHAARFIHKKKKSRVECAKLYILSFCNYFSQ